MIVSWNWLKQYVPLTMELSELEQRLAMAGLNHEGTETLAGDWAIDLEVTSNRPDCLGHIGVAREIAVLWDQPLTRPDPRPPAGRTRVEDLASVVVEAPDLCPRYTARVIRGVTIQPSPEWLAQRLRSIGQPVINNVVDITNFVLMECGQPLHAFDLAKLAGPRIIVRRAGDKETLEAIDHSTYTLDPSMCVIADAERAVALAGVMGGAATEVSEQTTDLLIESADFAPLSVRGTARQLKLHSSSSYRFERGVDPEGIDWASRRCCQLILELAGGELAAGVLDSGAARQEQPPVVLRLSQLPRILGITIEPETVQRILAALGGEVTRRDEAAFEIRSPSWRRDLGREIDWIEEVARIHGYDKIPEDVGVPMAPSWRSGHDRLLARVRRVLTAAGFDEAMTISMVDESLNRVFSPWTPLPALRCDASMLRGADQLRKSLVPSLLRSRAYNESVSNPVIELFETARVFLPREEHSPPREQWTLSISSGREFSDLKGVVEALLADTCPQSTVAIEDAQEPLLDSQESCRLLLDGQLFGFLGTLADAVSDQFHLRGRSLVAELNLDVLAAVADLHREAQPISSYPAISQDMNFVVDESLRWSQLEATARQAAGPMLEQLAFREIYRDTKRDGADRKRVLFSFTLRSNERTLTGEDADAVRQKMVDAIARQHGGKLL